MAKTLEDLERELPVVQAETIKEGDFTVSFYDDIVNANDLLKKCAIFAEFIGDKDLCKSLSARERQAAIRLADKIHDFTGPMTDFLTNYAEEME